MHIWNLVELDTYKEGEREEADKDFREPSLDPFSNGCFFLFGMAFNDMLRLEGPPPTPWLAIFNFKIPINNQKNHTQLSPNIKFKKLKKKNPIPLFVYRENFLSNQTERWNKLTRAKIVEKLFQVRVEIDDNE